MNTSDNTQQSVNADVKPAATDNIPKVMLAKDEMICRPE